MAATDSERFDVYFRGECLDGVDETTVRAALGRLFRADATTLDTLFGGELQRIKRGVDYPTAEKYRTAMEQAGARALIQPQDTVPDTARVTAQAQSGAQGADAATGAPSGNQGLDIAPVGSDVLRPEERPQHDAAAPATDHLDLAPAGSVLGEETAPVPAGPAPDFDVAEVGTDLLDDTPRSSGRAPDTSRITLAAPDHDLSDCAPTAPGTPPRSIDHLALTPPGVDLINDDERERPESSVPATDQFSLADAPDATEPDGGGTDNPFDRR